MAEIQEALDLTSDAGVSSGRVITGKYGEGKTHLLNTVRGVAHGRNMVVSSVTLSKETPMSNAAQLYAKILQGTYLPGYAQPGIAQSLAGLSLNSAVTSTLLEYSLTKLATNRLYYLLKSYLATQDDDEKYLLGADIEGDFTTSAIIRKAYRRIFGEPVTFNANFVKSRHISDYLSFLSKMFRLQGYGGWVILFDEAELIGRLGRVSRHKAYLNMYGFLDTNQAEGVYSIFAFNASFPPDVIEAKHEYDGVEKNDKLFPDEKERVRHVIDAIAGASQLAPLTREETAEALSKILHYHGKAFGWTPQMNAEDFMRATDPYGYLLRTRIRAAVEMLDQLFQYGEIDGVRASELGDISFEEDGDASLEEFV
jgi:hypothetical protein